jgi:molybdopterin/thiamine biosynthesis adenylyltransferase
MGIAETRNRLLRQLDLLDPNKCNIPVLIVGAGATGGYTALALAKMGLTDITIYDADLIEEHNFSNQVYPIKMLGMNKALAIKEVIKEYTEVEITAIPRMFTKNDAVEGIVISALDSMKGRKMLFKMCARNPKVKLFIDPRCGAEVCRVLTLVPELTSACEKYNETLHSDEQADPTPCTARSIIYSVLMVSSLICNQVKRYLMNQDLKRDILVDLNAYFSYFDN